MDKEDSIYIYNEILFRHKEKRKKETGKSIICDKINGPWRYCDCGELNKSDSERQILHDLTYVWNPKIKLPNYRKRDQICGYHRYGVGGKLEEGGWKVQSSFF